MFEEWEKRLDQTIYVSATPGTWELDRTGGEVVEQVIRPTGLLDPLIEIVTAKQQVTHLLGEIEKTVAAGNRVLVTALTKKLAEDLSAYFQERKVRCRWLHSELDAFERVELLHSLREAPSTCSWASTFSARASTCPKWRSSPFSTRTRRVFCGARHR